MTIEEKAKAYDVALEKARVFYNNEEARVGMTPIDLETIFPELKESDDERIRKNLIELFHDTVSNDEIFSDYGLDKTEVLAWLEKQGEQKTTWKPTEEQVEALEHFLETIRGYEYSYFHEETFLWLHSLLEQLKETIKL